MPVVVLTLDCYDDLYLLLLVTVGYLLRLITFTYPRSDLTVPCSAFGCVYLNLVICDSWIIAVIVLTVVNLF